MEIGVTYKCIAGLNIHYLCREILLCPVLAIVCFDNTHASSMLAPKFVDQDRTCYKYWCFVLIYSSTKTTITTKP